MVGDALLALQALNREVHARIDARPTDAAISKPPSQAATSSPTAPTARWASRWLRAWARPSAGRPPR
ncbi:acetolactate synthase large subunit [Bordetella pertussis]|nr:acetolactate synthase large subunit [Bordetella pertussis]